MTLLDTAPEGPSSLPEGPHAGLNKNLALVVLAIAQLMVVLDATIVNVALPNISSALHVRSSSDLQWVVTGYTLTFGGFLLLGGKLADRIGRRRVFLSGAALFATASLVGLGLFNDDQAEFRRKVKLVLLPGADVSNVPRQLSGVQRFSIGEPVPAHLEDLLRTLTNQPRYVPPPLGTVPVLPSRTLTEVEHAVTLNAVASLTAGGVASGALQLPSVTLS